MAEAGELIGIELEHAITIEIPPEFELKGKKYRLWQDPKYSKLTFSTPDVVERSLQLVMEGPVNMPLTGIITLKSEN